MLEHLDIKLRFDSPSASYSGTVNQVAVSFHFDCIPEGLNAQQYAVELYRWHRKAQDGPNNPE